MRNFNKPCFLKLILYTLNYIGKQIILYSYIYNQYEHTIITGIIMFALAIALVVVSNMDYNDDQCRSKGLARGVGIFYLSYVGILVIIFIVLAIIAASATAVAMRTVNQ